ncbi:T9SS type A sorting domain-containing protein [bacterium]|nr:T9SS type A sorting domain-containing protein [bacterium]
MFKKGIIPLLFAIGLCVPVFRAHAQDLAFPGAGGWAAYTPGGRGGAIIRVTNLNRSGNGSFASAVAASGPRIVVFEVGGVIDLNGAGVAIYHPYLTIAGQTAPSPGITVIDGSLSIDNTHDILIQHIRIRPGAARHNVGWEPDGISLNSSHHVILDHCSVSWAVDENMSASGPRFEGSTPDEWRANTSHTVTFSHNIIAEALSHATHSKGEHSKGSLIHDNVTEVAIVKNLYASNERRNPYFKAGARGVVVNNLIYNPGAVAIQYNLVSSEWGDNERQTGRMSVVGNFMKYGPSTQSPALMDADAGPLELFMDDNIALNQRGGSISLYDGVASKLVDTKPVWHDNLQIIPASDIFNDVIASAGARPWDRDEIDERIIRGVLDGTGEIIDFETDVGGFPVPQPAYAVFHEEDWDLSNMMSLFPTAQIISPVENELFQQDSTIIVSVKAGDYDGSVTSVELFVNGVSFGKDLSLPYKWQFSLNSIGDYTLVAAATDNSGRETITDATSIQVVDIIMYQFEMDYIGSGTVAQTPDGFVFEKGTEIKLTAMPEEGFEFAEWSGDLYGGMNPAILVMNDRQSITAHFIESVEPELSLYLAFDGTSRNTVQDLSDNSHLAFITNMNPIALISGPFGDALEFDGLDDYLRVFKKDALDFTAHGFSICFWIKTEETEKPVSWLSFMEGTIGYNIVQTLSQVRFEMNDGFVPSSVEVTSQTFTDGNWNFISAVVRRNPDELFLYKNTSLLSSAVDSTGSLSNTALNLLLATDVNRNDFFKGAMDEVRIYNYALTDAEILTLYTKNNTSYDSEAMPRNHVLSTHCYPNPFNPVTQIEYTVPEKNKIKLLVYNIYGQRVAVLEDDVKEAGKYQVIFDASKLPNGLYLVQLNMITESIGQKILLIK